MRQTSSTLDRWAQEDFYRRLPDITTPLVFADEKYTEPEHMPGSCTCIKCEIQSDMLFRMAFQSQGEA